MGVLFLGDEREDFVAMIEEVAQRVEHLGLGDAQGLGNLENRFTAPVQRRNVPDRHAQPIDHGLTAADALKADDVRVLSSHGFSHARGSKQKH
jgi:hypothetical protein